MKLLDDGEKELLGDGKRADTYVLSCLIQFTSDMRNFCHRRHHGHHNDDVVSSTRDAVMPD